FPFTLSRPIAEIRWGILTIKEKWEKLGCGVSYLTEDYLSDKFPCIYSAHNLYVNARLVPTEDILNILNKLEEETALLGNSDQLLALKSDEQFKFNEIKTDKAKKINLD